MDVFLGAWLLDPDLAPPGSFSELLSRFGLQQMTPLTAGYGQEAPSSFREMLPHDLSLLGPVMVRVYKELQVHLWTEDSSDNDHIKSGVL